MMRRPISARQNFSAVVPWHIARASLLLITAFGLSACNGARNPLDFTASIAGQKMWGADENQLSRQASELGRAYDKKPGEKTVSLRYAQVLRQQGQHGQALAVLQRASIANLNDTDVSAAYGKVLTDVGRFKEAGEVLARAHQPDRPDWRVLSAQGTVSDQMGDHARARWVGAGGAVEKA